MIVNHPVLQIPTADGWGEPAQVCKRLCPSHGCLDCQEAWMCEQGYE